MALIVKDSNGNISELAPATAIGLGPTQLGKEFEVMGAIVSRTSEQVGGTAVLVVAEGPGLASIWTNASYDPANPGSGWKRTINLSGGNVGIGGSKSPEAISPTERLVVAGNIFASGDVRLAGADCAEDFEIQGPVPEPGTVMVINDDEKLSESTRAYDTRVAGILSGAGDCRPGIILGRRTISGKCLPLALTGKAYCKVDADYSPITVGDMLTTSPTPGHAMRATERGKAFGAVLGKALRPLGSGKALVPILVCLQ